MGLKVNKVKTKYMVMARQKTLQKKIQVNEYSFERVRDFKLNILTRSKYQWEKQYERRD